jgi:hypothetical protein
MANVKLPVFNPVAKVKTAIYGSLFISVLTNLLLLVYLYVQSR